MKKVYFPNLNGIRFIAAFLVVIHHVELTKKFYGLPNYWTCKAVQIIGDLGVTLFFVLSGFLISYMLFVEKEHVGTIDVKGFYVRRILRIWPLYFFILILAFFLLPQIPQLDMPIYSKYIPHEFTTKLLLFLGFLPNAALILYPPVPFASQAWSIGVEEQFYLIWPVVIKFFKKSLYLLLSVVVLYWILNIIIHYLLVSGPSESFGGKLLFAKKFLALTRINCMAIGGVGAYILFERKDFLLNIFYAKITQGIVYLLVFLLIGLGVKIPYLNDEIYSLLFMIIIMNLASNKSSVFSLNNSIFDYLGKISYGLYMYHPLAIVISIAIFLKMTDVSIVSTNGDFFIYCISIVSTICISAISYEFFEKFFIKKKVVFSKIISGENARGDD